jgi:hypothetical protein
MLKNAFFWAVSRVALVRTEVLEDCIASIIRVARIGVTLMMGPIHFPGKSVLTRAKRREIPGDRIIHCHRRENPKSYIVRML